MVRLEEAEEKRKVNWKEIFSCYSFSVELESPISLAPGYYVGGEGNWGIKIEEDGKTISRLFYLQADIDDYRIGCAVSFATKPEESWIADQANMNSLLIGIKNLELIAEAMSWAMALGDDR